MNLSSRVIGCAFEVHRALGNGFLESVYDNALAIELARNNIDYKRQFQIAVIYKNRPVG
jgi:GxxExxY protein